MENKKVDTSISSPVEYSDRRSSSLPFGHGDHKNNIVIPPLLPSELESLWEAIEADRGFSPSRREKPFASLTLEEQKQEIEADLDALGRPYEADIELGKIKVKQKILINHDKKFITFDKVKELHRKAQYYCDIFPPLSGKLL